MKNVYAAMLAACLGTLGAPTVQAQNPNTAYGSGALASNTTGFNDGAFGYEALYFNTTGYDNTATGSDALYSNISGVDNTAAGQQALYSNTTGSSNTATGNSALYSNTTGYENTATGGNALSLNTQGNYNTATGLVALGYNTTGNENTATGTAALGSNITGNDNTASGEDSLGANTTGDDNTAAGNQALLNNKTGSFNIAVGYKAGYNIGGSNNIAIGSEGTASDKSVIRIGTEKMQTTFYAAGVSGVPISNGVPVYINGNGQMGTVNSSIRFKEDVHDMADASSRLLELRPVTYRYKQAYADGSKPVDYGLIAEEVAQVYPDMVARDASGEILTVQYQKLTPMLLNEVQKQQRQLGAQQETIQMLERRLSALEATMVAGHAQKQAAE